MRQRRTELQVFESKIVGLDGACWMWGGNVQNAGYAQMSTYKKTYLAHRWSYEFFRGGLDPTLTLDHKCRNKLCVNPFHLEQVTRVVNIQRAPISGVAKKAADKTHCQKGHDYAIHGVVYKNGFTITGIVKFARRCTVCNPNYKRYVQ